MVGIVKPAISIDINKLKQTKQNEWTEIVILDNRTKSKLNGNI